MNKLSGKKLMSNTGQREVHIVLYGNWSRLPDLHELKNMQRSALQDDAPNPTSEARIP